jgi:hypothetical protein
MLGKVAEKRDHDPSVFLSHFAKVKVVYMNGVQSVYRWRKALHEVMLPVPLWEMFYYNYTW